MKLFWTLVYKWKCCVQSLEDAIEGLYPIAKGALLSFFIYPILLSRMNLWLLEL